MRRTIIIALSGFLLAATPFLNAHAQKEEIPRRKDPIAALQAAVDDLASQQAALQAAVAALSSQQTAAFAADSGLDPIAVTQNTGVVSLNLPEGNYVFSGKVLAGDAGTTNVVICVLFNQGGGGGPSILDISQTPALTAGSFATLPMVGRLSLAGTATISIVCTAQNAGNAIAQYAHLYAVRVATLQ
jgi:hypothetical protein